MSAFVIALAATGGLCGLVAVRALAWLLWFRKRGQTFGQVMRLR